MPGKPIPVLRFARRCAHTFRLPAVCSHPSAVLLVVVAAIPMTGCAVLAPPVDSISRYESEYGRGTDASMNGSLERNSHGDGAHSTARTRPDRQNIRGDAFAPTLRDDLIHETNRWTGTPYQFGGESRSGIDCSAFMQVLFRDALGYTLPRSTTAQRTVGRSVRRSDLRTGDLVFFETGPRQKHVGVYLGEGEFAHSSSSAGVSVSNLSESYWNSRFEEGIRPRDLPVGVASSADASPRSQPAVERNRSTRDRVSVLRRGW